MGPYCFIGKFYQTYKEEIIPIIHQLFNKIKEEELFPNSFYEASIIPIQNSDKAKPLPENKSTDQYHKHRIRNP